MANDGRGNPLVENTKVCLSVLGKLQSENGELNEVNPAEEDLVPAILVRVVDEKYSKIHYCDDGQEISWPNSRIFNLRK